MQNLKSDEETAKQEIARFDNSGREFIKGIFTLSWKTQDTTT